MRLTSDVCDIRSSPDELLFERIATAIERQGYIVLPGALPEPLAKGLEDYLAELETDDFHSARIGRGPHQTRNQFVRRDRIYWIEREHPGATAWLDWLDRLKHFLNRRLFLGLFAHESHFSHYQPGDFYRRHLDAFRGESNRVVSMVTYLNRGWLPEHGGELALFAPDSETELVRVVPACGTLVLFLSEEFPHEVLPTRRQRFGVASWFRINTSTADNIDPPR